MRDSGRKQEREFYTSQMKGLDWLLNKVLTKVLNSRDITKYDESLGRDSLYLRRFYLKRGGKKRYFLHYFARSDDDRFPHDHPWDFTVFILNRGYWEEIKNGKYKWRPPWTLRRHPAEWLHRVHLTEGPCWTIFMPDRKRREWGFLTDKGWVHHKEYLSSADRADSETKAPIV